MDANCVAIQVPRLSVCLSIYLLDVLWWFTDWLKMRQSDVQYVQIWHGYFRLIYVEYVLICLGYFRPTEYAELSHRFHSKLAADRASLKKNPIISPFRLNRDSERRNYGGGEEVSKVCSSEVPLIRATALPETEHSEVFLARGPPSPESLSHFLSCRSTGGIQQNHAGVCVSLQTGESPCRLKHTYANCYKEFVDWVVFGPNFNLNN